MLFHRPGLTDKVLTSGEAFDLKLKNYLSLGTRTQASARDELIRVLDHPGRLLATTLLSDDHPLKREAWAVSDAFEAVTNGMDNPEALDLLRDIEETSPLFPWKAGILALEAFYAGSQDLSRAWINQVPTHSPLASLRRLLEGLWVLDDRNLGDYERTLFQGIYTRDPQFTGALEQIWDSLDTGMEDLFWTAGEDLLAGLIGDYPGEARSVGLWIIRQLETQDFDPAPLTGILKRVFGATEGCRLLALGLLPFDPEGAALYWLQFLILGTREGALEGALEDRARTLFLDFCRAAKAYQKKEGCDPEFQSRFEHLLNQVEAPLRERWFPWTSWDLLDSAPGQPPLRKTNPAPGPVQFDLFAS